MRTLLLTLISCLIALPILAAGPPVPPPADKAAPEAPPSPPPVTWVVDGYKAVGLQWVKQPDHCLKTTDLRKAGEYEAELLRFQEWIAVSNIPAVCSPAPDRWERPTAMVSPPTHPRPRFLVWAFHLIDGKWVKDEKYCWASSDTYTCRLDALAYAAKVNAVPSWRATTNAPEATYAHRNDTIVFHGPLGWNSGYGDGGGDGNCIGTSRGGYPVYSEHGGRTIYRPHMTIRTGADAAAHYTPTDDWVERQAESDRRQNEINALQNQ